MWDSARASWVERRKLRAERRRTRRNLRRAQSEIYVGLLHLTIAIRNHPDCEPENLAKYVEARRLVSSALAITIAELRSLRNFIGLRPRWHYSNLERDMVPPIGACFLLDLILPKADREVIPDDLVEEFTTSILGEYGVRRARFWFWTQTVRTIATRNPVCRWALVGGLARIGEWILRKMGS
jgi:hypothetical protein